jgi:hypothetical protein
MDSGQLVLTVDKNVWSVAREDMDTTETMDILPVSSDQDLGIQVLVFDDQ